MTDTKTKPFTEKALAKTPICNWYGKRFGGYNNCISCEGEIECKEATGDNSL
jgi:hypothetical protein